MPLTLAPTAQLSPAAVFLRSQGDGEYRIYRVDTPHGPSVSPFITPNGIKVPQHLSPWDACEMFMQLGYLPPFDLVQTLPSEEVNMGEVVRRLWILRGARRTAKLVQESGRVAALRVHELKKEVTRWR